MTTIPIRSLEQPTAEVRAERVEAITSILRLHSSRHLIDPNRCQCGKAIPVEQSLHAHAVEQALIGLPLVPVLVLPPDAELLDRALTAIAPEADAEQPSEEDLARRADIVRVHEAVYAPLIKAMCTEIGMVALAWETLAGLFRDTIAEHSRERYELALDRASMRDERDQATAKARLLGKANGRQSATIYQLRGELAQARDRRWESDNKRGAAVADLVATQRQVERQQETIRALLEQVRELGGTVDDALLLDAAAAGTEAGR
jgi:hypothetical protein